MAPFTGPLQHASAQKILSWTLIESKFPPLRLNGDTPIPVW